MANVIRKLSLSRRTFLRGVGAAVALPWLDAMAAAATPGAGPKDITRAVFLYVPNGKKMDEWTPKSKGLLGDLPWILEPLAPFKSDLNVLSGLALDGARAHGDGPGDHARATSAFLTCAHPFKTGGADIKVGQSIDQLFAERIGAKTPFASLELGIEGGRSGGVCDSGYSCAYTNNLSWKTPSTPVAKETNPREVFRRLFGDPEDAADQAQARAQSARRRSVLDVVHEEAKALRNKVGPSDRTKLDQYLSAVRDLELRLNKTDDQKRPIPEMTWTSGGEDSYAARVGQMFDLITLAFQADLTRIVTFMLANAGSNRSYAQIGIAEGHHDLSHHGRNKGKLEKIRRINRYHIELLTRFAGSLSKAEDGGATLLQNAAIVYGCGISDGDRHNHEDLPVLLLGRGAGRIKGGRHLSHAKDTPLANLYLALAPVVGLTLNGFGDSTGPLSLA